MKFVYIFIYRKSNAVIYFIDTYITELNIQNYTIIAKSCNWCYSSRLNYSYYVSGALISPHRLCAL